MEACVVSTETKTCSMCKQEFQGDSNLCPECEELVEETLEDMDGTKTD